MTRILVIEDRPEILAVLVKFLQIGGYQVVEASSADEGLRLYRQNPTDLVITDIFMPGKNGIELIVELLTEYADAKIIAMAGEHDVLTTAQEAGACAILPKPFLMNDLKTMVSKLLKEGST